MTYIYTVYGFTVATPFPCELRPAPPAATPDIQVIEDKVPFHLDAPLTKEDNWEAAPGIYLHRGGKRVGRFLVEDGKRITFQRAPQAEDNLIALVFLDSIIVAILRQQGKIVLHANAALTPNGAVAISGESGAGKSTTLTALLQKGCSMLADDILALQMNPQGQVEVALGAPQMNLLDDAAQSLHYDVSGSPRHRWRSGKSIVSTHEYMAETPAPLKALYLLEKNPALKEIHPQLLTGAEKFIAVQGCIYGPMFPEEHSAAFPFFSTLIEQTAVYRIQRPVDHWSIPAVLDFIHSSTS